MDNDLQKFIKCDIFSPDNICQLMSSKLHGFGSLLEPSVGTGNLLKFIDTKKYSPIDVYELKSEYLVHITDEKINKRNEDFIKAQMTQKYDNIIMNPPYIRIQDLSVSYRKYLKEHFLLLNDGLVDIYYAFIIKCLELLNENGKMVAITPNTYLYNKSSAPLRKYLFENKWIEEIIDFKDKRVFDDAHVYCCITVFTKTPKDTMIYNDTVLSYSDININYSLFHFHPKNGETRTLKDICKISNGIATLRDKIFIHSTKLYDEPCWKPITNGNDIKYIIYPYENGKIMDENKFKNQNPQTYSFLEQNRGELQQRDKGNKVYPAWFAYGRSQSVIPPSKKCIFISCFVYPQKMENFIFVKEPCLFHGCLCVQPHKEEDNEKIVNCIIKNRDFISQNSTKRSGGWISLSSSVLYNVLVD